MDYKKIIKSQKARIAILNMLEFIPDKQMIEIQYWIKTGYRLNLKHPKRYTEKLQWYKLYYRNPLMASCVDKYAVREFVKRRGLGYILNKAYGVYDDPKEIPFESLPKSFVMKDTLGGGGNSVILVRNKDSLDKEKLLNRLSRWVNTPIKNKNVGREWVYENRKHRILIEKLLDCNNGDLPDYKFFCFDGEPVCLYLMRNYRDNHEYGELAFLDIDFRLLNVYRADFRPLTLQPKKPSNYEKMVEMARILSKGFPHVRVDFYDVDGEIIFGELTFFNASGYFKFEPDEFDYKLGEKFILPEKG